MKISNYDLKPRGNIRYKPSYTESVTDCVYSDLAISVKNKIRPQDDISTIPSIFMAILQENRIIQFSCGNIAKLIEYI